MSRFYKFLFLSFFMLFLLNSQAHAAVYTCGTNGVNNSCSPSGLTSIVSSATHGDTINIARGSHDWTSSVTLSKRLTITGGGSCPDCGDEDPTSTWDWPTTLNTNRNMAFLINGSDGSNPNFVRISGLFIDGDPPNHSYSNGANTASIVMHTNNEMRYRIDNIRFRPSGNSEQSSVRTNSDVGFGVTDHVYVSTSGAGSNGRFIHNTGHGGDAGDTDWTRPVVWGSQNFHFIEDSTFNFPDYGGGIPAGVEDQQGGGRCVIRYNYIKDANLGNHGTESGWPARSGVAQEIYENYIESNGNMFTANYWRGGSMYMYNNTVRGFQELIRWRVQRLTSSYGPGVCGSPGTEGIDGPGPPSGYPCIDQVGTGTAAGYGINNTQPQGRNPVYVWNNTRISTPVIHGGDWNSGYVEEGRDVFFSEDSSAAPSGYKAYAYPHPFVEPLVADDTIPNPPTDVTISN
jgi:hypothetical protein